MNPWVYYVAWVWLITVAKDGVIWLWGQVVSFWSWVWNSVADFFSGTKSIEQEYNDAKKECRPSKNHKTTNDERNNNSREWDKFSTLDFYDNWKLKKRRYFGWNWIADFDIDFEHWNWDNSHTFPHCHKWINGVRSKDPYPCCK